MVVDALGAPADPGLAELLGAERAARVGDALRDRARRWAAAVAVHGHTGPLLLAAPDVPALDVAVARVALEDLAAGCDIVLGVAHDALPYLVAMPRPDDELIALAASGFTGGVLQTFGDRGLTLGMLAHHRRLVTAGDARAFALDPLTPPDLAALLR